MILVELKLNSENDVGLVAEGGLTVESSRNMLALHMQGM